MTAFTRKPMINKLPSAIPDGDISCREPFFFEIQDRVAQDIFVRRVVQHFRRSSKIELEGQVTLEDGR
jgi:hypothetical protein